MRLILPRSFWVSATATFFEHALVRTFSKTKVKCIPLHIASMLGLEITPPHLLEYFRQNVRACLFLFGAPVVRRDFIL